MTSIHSKFPSTRRSLWFNWLVLFTLVSGISCSPPTDPFLDMLDSQLSNVRVDNLSRTMNFVVSPERFQKAQFEEKLVAALNRWGKSESDLMAPENWQLDPMATSLAEYYGNLLSGDISEGLRFVNTDSYYLQQHFWLKKLAQRLVDNKEIGAFEIYRIAAGVDLSGRDQEVDALAVTLNETHKGLSVAEAEQLASAVKLFDWVIRNIHLLPEDDLTAEIENLDDLRLNDSKSLPAAGIPGVGYTRFPWQTLLFSRGDYVDRAKLFMMLIKQQEIDSVMFTSESNDEKKPWVVGVNIGGKLFLFDTKLGLPIPGSTPGSIATFTDLRADPDLLNSLDLSVNESLKDDTNYWVNAKQLGNMDALVLASPESLSYRFWELENKLVGEARMNLVMEPSDIVNRFPKIEGVEYGVWDIEFKTHEFRRALRDAIAEASFKDDVRDKIQWYFNEEFYINEFVRYRTARSKYFNGLFETIRNDGNLNAIELFYSMIYKDSKIESLATDRVFQVQLALTQDKLSSFDFERMINGVQQNMKLVRRDSGFFLSQCHFDNGNFSTAANWLTRLEQIENTVRWQAGINYLRARSLEAQRDYDPAIEIYEKQESEQFHGDLLRVRQLKAMSAGA